jgi:hypothetical protein
MPCSVCGKNKAILELENGRFQPCWDCQKDNWLTLQLDGIIGKIIKKIWKR